MIPQSIPISEYSECARRFHLVLQCALTLLRDGCPMDSKAHICRYVEIDDDEMCTRCWDNYIYACANGNGIRYKDDNQGGVTFETYPTSAADRNDAE